MRGLSSRYRSRTHARIYYWSTIMSTWGDPIHPTHVPSEPRNEGFSSDVVYCCACGALLRSSRGMSTKQRVRAVCIPLPAGTDTVPRLGPRA